MTVLSFAMLYRSNYETTKVYTLSGELLGTIDDVIKTDNAYSYIFSIELIDSFLKIIIREDRLYGDLNPEVRYFRQISLS